MNFYDRYILPPILDFVMRQDQLEEYRRAVSLPRKDERWKSGSVLG
jgi:hypothetical protein